MTPEQILAVRRVVVAAGHHPDLGARFYRRLFGDAPGAEALFAGDPVRQQRALAAELRAMAELLDDLPSLEARARELGARHRGYGVEAIHHRVSRTALVDTFAEVLGEGFGPEEQAAWTRAASLISELMQAT